MSTFAETVHVAYPATMLPVQVAKTCIGMCEQTLSLYCSSDRGVASYLQASHSHQAQLRQLQLLTPPAQPQLQQAQPVRRPRHQVCMKPVCHAM